MKKALLAILLILTVLSASAQDTLVDKARVRRNVGIVLGVEAGFYAASMTGLYFAWYAGYPQSSFHFYNDNAEWMLMDKAGHLATAYRVGHIGYDALRIAGLDENRSIWYGGTLGLAFLTTVEVFDGISQGWGFSWGDMAADISGIALYTSQQLLWDEQRVSLKYSFHPTEYAQYNPEELGHNLISQALKDYNGITIWAAFNVKDLFLKSDSSFPEWITVDVGYGAKGMIAPQPTADFDRVRQFYIAPGVDLAKLPVENRYLKALLRAFSFIKLPTPALEYNTSDKFVWHWFYF